MPLKSDRTATPMARIVRVSHISGKSIMAFGFTRKQSGDHSQERDASALLNQPTISRPHSRSSQSSLRRVRVRDTLLEFSIDSASVDLRLNIYLVGKIKTSIKLISFAAVYRRILRRRNANRSSPSRPVDSLTLSAFQSAKFLFGQISVHFSVFIRCGE